MAASYLRLLQLFRERHPLGTVVADLVRSDAGLYTVRAEVRIDRKWVLGSGLAVHADLEKAEERAIERALQAAGFASGAKARPEEAPAPLAIEPVSYSLALDESPPVTNGNGSGPIKYVTTANGHTPPEMPAPEPEPPVDLSDLLARTDVEMQRIGWGAKEGRDYLQRTFGKSSRHQLDGDELQIFLRHLKGQANQLPRRPQAPF